MNAHSLTERLLALMEKKDHWAWVHFTQPGLSRTQLLTHFRHEYHTYVRDFPVMLARVLGQGPPEAVRKALAENVYEEQTGKLSFGLSHPELFLDMMAGLGFAASDLEMAVGLEGEARAYRAFLDKCSQSGPWQVGAAVLTIFVEGSKHERAELSGTRELSPLEQAVAEHPMVRFYGCPPERMRLVRAHRLVERGHRRDAWEMVLGHVPPDGPLADAVVAAISGALDLWLAYRDGVARSMGLGPERG